MIEDLLTNRENSNSILIVDSFEKNANALICLFIQKLIERENVLVNLYPSEKVGLKRWTKFKKAQLKRTLLENLFISGNTVEASIFDLILQDLAQNEEGSISKKKFLVFDNINLIVRHLNGDPFCLFHFLIDLRKKNRDPNIGVLMIVHEESIDQTVINQLKSIVQTVVQITDTSLKQHDLKQFPKLNKHLFKYNLTVDNKSYRSFKVISHNETLYMTDDLEILKVEKHLKKSTDKKLSTVQADKEEDPLKGLTFNVHLSPDDLEAKRNLVLPYEIVGKQKQQEQKQFVEQDSKIFYAPDERDDVDDDDPDDDLNF